MKKIVVVPYPDEKPKISKRKIKPRWNKQAVLPILLCVAVVFGSTFALSYLPVTPSQAQTPSYTGVLELLNVESFEGGCGSRSSWLTSCAKNFEKNNKGLFVHVTTISSSQLQSKLQQGYGYDLICFSLGDGSLVVNSLAPISCSSKLLPNYLNAGKVGNKQLALPLYCGAYCLFSRSSVLQRDQLISQALTKTQTRKVGKSTYKLQPLVCGFTQGNSPLSALARSGAKGTFAPNYQLTQYNAYEQFVANKTAVTLLGTQRDYFRLNNKQQLGKIEQIEFVPLGDYNDLVQFIGVNASCGNKLAPCRNFVDYLLSNEAQSKLTNLCLFSALQGGIYTQGDYFVCQQAIGGAFVPDVFCDDLSIQDLRQNALIQLQE